MSKKIIAVDMDDTILYLMKAIQEDHNRKHPDQPVKYEDMIAFDDSMLHPEYSKLEFFHTEGTFLHLKIMQDAAEELEKIHEAYDLIIVTAAFPDCVPDKWTWLQHHLPFIPERNFITTSRKDLIQADILIDDAIHNVVDWVKTGRRAIVPRHHWNTELAVLPGVMMISEWKGVKEKIDYMLGEDADVS